MSKALDYLQWTDDCGGDKVYGDYSRIGQFYGVAYPDGGYGVSFYLGDEQLASQVDYVGGNRTQAEAMVIIEKWCAERVDKVKSALREALK